MQPNKKLITIKDNLAKIELLLDDLVLRPRLKAHQWAHITKQTPNIKVGYPGQHLASLITGIEGERTGARGNDLIDGSEVKSCSRIDQLDACNDCNAVTARHENVCPKCGSTNISRNNDSKWLFSIRNRDDLDFLLRRVNRVVLLLGDYPEFDSKNYDLLRVQSFEIWPASPRHRRFAEIMTNYYNKIYLEHKRGNPDRTPALKNFWPYSYQFYLCNPILTFSCTVSNANTKPSIRIDHYTPPNADRGRLSSVRMPPSILKTEEVRLLLRKAPKNLLKGGEVTTKRRYALPPEISEELRGHLPLRDTDRISTAKKKYSRRTYGG